MDLDVEQRLQQALALEKKDAEDIRKLQQARKENEAWTEELQEIEDALFGDEGEFHFLKEEFDEQRAQTDALRRENAKDLGKCPIASCDDRVGQYSREDIFMHFKNEHSGENCSFSCPLKKDGVPCNVKITPDRVQGHYQHIGDTALGPRRHPLGINIQDMHRELVEANSNVLQADEIARRLLSIVEQS